MKHRGHKSRTARALAPRPRAATVGDLDDFFARTPDLLFMVDADGRWLRLNPAWGRVLDRAPEDLVGRPWAEVVHADDRTSATAVITSLAGDDPVDFTARVVQPDGAARWLAWRVARRGRGGGWCGSARVAPAPDAAGQGRSREGLEHILRQVFEQAPEAIAVHRDGRYVWANPAMAALLGYADAAALMGAEVMAGVHPDDQRALAVRIDAILTTGQVQQIHHARLVRRDGGAAAVEAVGVRVEHDGAAAVVELLRDVTERDEAQAQFILADRLGSVGALAAGIAHEINNPLTVAAGNLELLVEELPAPAGAGAAEGPAPQAALLAAEAYAGLVRVRDIVRDLSRFAQPNALRRAPLDVQTVLESAVTLAGNQIRYRARLVRRYVAAPPVEANEADLRHVFLDLLLAAAGAIPDGNAGGNEIRLRVAPGRPGEVVAEVEDTSPGISPEALGRIFDPYVSPKSDGFGRSLGLSVCHALATRLGGVLTVESVVGRGSVYRVVLRAYDPYAP